LADVIKTIEFSAGEASVVVKSPTEHLQHWWMSGHFYEAALLEHIYSLNLEGVYIDVGSCIGNHTLFFAKFCKSYCVFSIEPVASSVQHQREILDLNNISAKVAVRETAVSSRNGRGKMERFGVQENVGMYHLVPGTDVNICRLDSIVPSESVSCLKIDVEGRCIDVLEGSSLILSMSKPRLFVELMDEDDYTKSYRFLKMFGYQAIGKYCSTPTYEFV